MVLPIFPTPLAGFVNQRDRGELIKLAELLSSPGVCPMDVACFAYNVELVWGN